MRLCLAVGILTALPTTGCDSTQRTAGPPACSVHAQYCDTSDFASASEEALRSNPGWVEISCPPYPYSPAVETVMPECRELVKAATLLAVANNRFVLEPIDMAKVQFRHAIEAFDTFIPGREEADEHTVIYAKIPLRWKSERTEPKDGNAQ